MKCGKPVVIEYIWTGGRHFACLEHAEQIEKIGLVMGMSTKPRPIISEMECPCEVRKGEEEKK